MRLSVFIPENSPQLLIDLKKLYQGYLNEQDLTDASLKSLISDPQSLFFVTLFNARHLGAVEVITKDEQATLKHLCVREITRRRGVGKNLLGEVEKHLSNKNISTVTMPLANIREDEQATTKEFMQSCGYQIIENRFIKKLS
ncbi:aspartate 1-decarboxylase autocleavage activator PanM [Psychromonas sp. KJ10-10]|uniref:aspartate 1-decarboxylase autocleavage activator PanM n=1 Tax=Psychromonas sp. KJ10-10 TaxID=3391823 RepID=UPI0039B615B4